MSEYSARDLLRIPGLLSLSRLPLAVVFAFSVERVPWAIGILVLAGVTDVLDGWYARRFDQRTRTGAVLDAVMDKVFVALVVVALVASHALTVGQVLLLGARDIGELLIGAQLAAQHGNRLTAPHPPHVLGKATTCLQYLSVAAAVVRSPYVGALAIATGVAGIVATVGYWLREQASADHDAHRHSKHV
ncbi:MAG TPA: CDP-alcohol phosphatidyltransferase family protein [Labilithrix sp.]|nr:CDP-alcohol phosphatidyltransferase family protein [Labilithrix sp.]